MVSLAAGFRRLLEAYQSSPKQNLAGVPDGLATCHPDKEIEKLIMVVGDREMTGGQHPVDEREGLSR